MIEQTVSLHREVVINIGNYESVRITIGFDGVPMDNMAEANEDLKKLIIDEVNAVNDINGIPRSIYRYTGDN